MNLIQDFLYKNAFNVVFQIIILVIALSFLFSRVQAIEERNEKVDPLIERFYVVEQKELESAENIKEIKETVKNIEKKIDQYVLGR